MSEQSSLNLPSESKTTGPVECLGQTFASEEARREHYLALLAEKLKDPEFRKIEGFPIGKDEDILALSDPPYYTACPNPWLADFVKCYGTPYDPKKAYHREPFAADVSEGKNHPIYNAHSYHTKVPHRAIMRYILHYTEPGDLVFDGFCGTGMTGVAAQLCGDRKEVQELGYRVLEDGTILNEEGKAFSKLGARRAVLNDLSPAATFIAANYNLSGDVQKFERDAKFIIKQCEDAFGWMYETLHTDGRTKGRINYTIWSQVFACPECGNEIVFWDAAVDLSKGKVRDQFNCSKCNAQLDKRSLQSTQSAHFDKSLQQTIKQTVYVPARIYYSVAGKRYEKEADAEDKALAMKIDTMAFSSWVPTDRMPEGGESRRNDPSGITHVHHFYTTRILRILAEFRKGGLKFWAPFSALTPRATRMHRIAASRLGGEKQGVGGATVGVIAGTLYVPSLSVEMNVFDQAVERIRAFLKAHFQSRPTAISNQSTTAMTGLPDESLDYIFVDPPFGANLMYAELNFLWEAWLQVFTCRTKEAIEDKETEKTISDYRDLMTCCFRVMFRKLKPGRWMTVEFSNTQASIWNSIQTGLQEAGFVVANVSALDRQQLSFKAITSPTAVKQDLVISAYKPNGGLEERFAKAGEKPEGAWEFVKTHLRNLPVVKARAGQLEPILERDPRILYDRMVAFYVGHSVPVPLSSAEFQAGLAERFPERDGMFFLAEQVAEYDKKRAVMDASDPGELFISDERTAIAWLRRFLKDRPSVQADIYPQFMPLYDRSKGYKKAEAMPDIRALLDQNFLRYDGTGEVPSQIHAYLSTQFKELRNLPKDHPQLRARAKDRWYVPDPKNLIQVEELRNKRLLEEFWNYLPDGYRVQSSEFGVQSSDLPTQNAEPETQNPKRRTQNFKIPKIPRSKKLKEVRTEAVRVGFKHCYQAKDYGTILAVAEMLPESILNEDEQLQMLYDNAAMRSGAES